MRLLAHLSVLYTYVMNGHCKDSRKFCEEHIAQSHVVSVNFASRCRPETATTESDSSLKLAAEGGPDQTEIDRAKHTEHGELPGPRRCRGLSLHDISHFPSVFLPEGHSVLLFPTVKSHRYDVLP